jgi:hypothetical protein
MARRGQVINVKIPRTKVIGALNIALKKLETDYINQSTNEKKYNALHKKWEQQIIKLATAKFSKATNIRINSRHNGDVNIDFDLPANSIVLPEEPSRDFNAMHDWQYKDNKEELENTIRILSMCEDEYISTATYGAISKYL